MEQIRWLMLDLKSYYPSPAYQLGLLVAYAAKEPEVRKNMSFTFREFGRERPAMEIAREIFSAEADCVCASNYAWNYKKICDVLDILTKAGGRLPRILLGGPNSPGAFGDELMARYPIISAMVEGEGEPAFRDICCSLLDSPQKDPALRARNCVVRGENREVLRPNLGHRIEYLDEVPSPYLTGILPASPSPIFYETNRGCPYRCSFCYWGNGNSKVYRMSLERVREEMEFFAKHKVSYFWLADANFGIFKTDAEIAEMMGEINGRYGYPFKHVGVNWAKNSGERVVEISSLFKRGRMGCTTTLAVQSVSPEAEEKSKRYSMHPAKFTGLVSVAHEREMDTYTDIIWGLPGENVEEYLAGLDAVISTGVPSILIHQLYLLPGTEFYEKRAELGLKMLSDEGGTAVDPSERSDYWDYIVVSHPKMNRDDMRRGNRILGINHLLHNLDLGRVVDFYLSRYGVTHSEVYNFLDAAILGKISDFPREENSFFSHIRGLILEFAHRTGLDEFVFYSRLSEVTWFREEPGGNRKMRMEEVLAFMREFYEAFCREHGIAQKAWEIDLLRDLVDYNVAISPKPGWNPKPGRSFRFDVHAIWLDMEQEIYRRDDPPGENISSKEAHKAWRDLARKVPARLAALLTDEYLLNRKTAMCYTLKNPWFAPPRQGNSDWLLSTRSKHCVVSAAVAAEAGVVPHQPLFPAPRGEEDRGVMTP